MMMTFPSISRFTASRELYRLKWYVHSIHRIPCVGASYKVRRQSCEKWVPSPVTETEPQLKGQRHAQRNTDKLPSSLQVLPRLQYPCYVTRKYYHGRKLTTNQNIIWEVCNLFFIVKRTSLVLSLDFFGSRLLIQWPYKRCWIIRTTGCSWSTPFCKSLQASLIRIRLFNYTHELCCHILVPYLVNFWIDAERRATA